MKISFVVSIALASLLSVQLKLAAQAKTLQASTPVATNSSVSSISTTANLSNVSILKTMLIKPNPQGVFSTKFSNAATGRNDVNAYLLCYLSTLIYPQYLAMVANPSNVQQYETRLHTNPTDFEKEFVRYTKDLFPSPEFKFFHKSDRLGYDPEAMVISTPTAIFIVFRGTDRVGSNNPNSNFISSTLFNWSEWISTDFDARQITDSELTGKVSAGMWSSLKYEGFKDEMLNFLISKGARTKKVWITGHSLGGGQAQLYAMFLAKKSIVPQGVYVYASPHPGNQTFANELNRLFPSNRLQRFDFLTDPITALAPRTMEYARAGTRVYYNDVNSIQFGANERSDIEVTNLIPGIMGAISNGVTDFINEASGKRLKLDNLLGSSTMCYHHPLWYLQAAYNQLNTANRAAVPAPLNLPDANSEGCDYLTVERGRTSNNGQIISNIVQGVVDNAQEAIDNALAVISFNANSILSNITGAAIADGNYYIQSYASGEKLGINEQNGFSNGIELKLTTEKSKVKITRTGAGGYLIEFGKKTVTTSFFGITSTETREYVLDSERESLYQSNSSEIHLWEKNNVPGLNANQRWLFINIPGHSDKYIIKNLANGKVLDANNGCVNANSCGIKTYPAKSNDQTQIWVLKRA